MRYIIKGGIDTKNVPKNCMDAISLAVCDDNVEGVLLSVYETKDKHFVIYHKSNIDGIKTGIGNINEMTLDELKRHNFGNKTRIHSILELSDVLRKFSTTCKVLVLEVSGCSNSDDFIISFSDIVNRYPNANIYIKSCSKEMLGSMSSHIKKAKVGADVSDDYSEFKSLNLDFYCLQKKIDDCKMMEDEIKQGKAMMIENFNDSDELQHLMKTNGKLFEVIFIVIDDYMSILKFN